MEEICFKVVSKDDLTGELSSALITGPYKNIYSQKCYVKAPEDLRKIGYHILVFKDLDSAMNFSRINKDWIKNPKIYTCFCRKEIYPLPYKMGVLDLNEGNFLKLKYEEFPIGTRMFEEIKLGEEVK